MSTWYQENIRVQYKDTDQMGVVHHGNYVTWFEIGRTEWMRHKGMTYSQLENQRLLLPVMDVQLQYKLSAKYDDCVAVFTRVSKASPIRLEFEYEVRRIDEVAFAERGKTESLNPYGELLTKGSSTHMWVNSNWKPTKINKVAPEVYDIVKK